MYPIYLSIILILRLYTAMSDRVSPDDTNTRIGHIGARSMNLGERANYRAAVRHPPHCPTAAACRRAYAEKRERSLTISGIMRLLRLCGAASVSDGAWRPRTAAIGFCALPTVPAYSFARFCRALVRVCIVPGDTRGNVDRVDPRRKREAACERAPAFARDVSGVMKAPARLEVRASPAIAAAAAATCIVSADRATVARVISLDCVSATREPHTIDSYRHIDGCHLASTRGRPRAPTLSRVNVLLVCMCVCVCVPFSRSAVFFFFFFALSFSRPVTDSAATAVRDARCS